MTTKTGASILIGSVIPAALALLPLSSPLADDSVDGSLQVSAEVIAVCAVTSAPLEFGFYSADSNTDALAAITVHCSTETPGTISLGFGLHADDDDQRQMAFLESNLAYNLYRDSNREHSFDIEPVTGMPGGGDDLIVYGRIPQGQTAAPVGEYADTVQITFAY